MSDDLARRVALIEDREAIRRLKHLYCRLCDNGYDAASLVALFTDDGVWDAGEAYGRFVGKAAMRGFFEGMPKAVSFSVHTALNDIIDVNGDEATAHWRAIIPSTFRTEAGGEPHWLFVEYDDAFRRVNGQWLFTRCRSIIHASGPHGAGWVA